MKLGGSESDSTGTPHLVGVINISPESPNQDAVVSGPAGAVARARELARYGVRILDIGGQSSHFAAPLVAVEEEQARLLPALRDLTAAGFLVAVDTWDPATVRLAAANGAALINDSDGFQDPEMIDAIAESGLPVILPFINGPNPRAMQPIPGADSVAYMCEWFEAALDRCRRAGVHDIILDPGTGYAQPHLSTTEKEAWQRSIYPRLPEFRRFGYPLFIALPRKADRTVTLELARMILSAGVDFLRVHDAVLAREAMASAE